jgi:2-amino-4-hydroxy-6-hydroxymethyldihydropteridine diphosphokinase
MPEVFIGAGSNADPERGLHLALAELERRFGTVRRSRVYRSAAVGAPAADYRHVVLAFKTALSADALKDELRAIEALAGRAPNRVDRAGCELDLDLLLYGRCVDAGRRLPRPGVFTLPFVVVPLAELAPELRHPVSGELCGTAALAAAHDTLTDAGAIFERG